MCSLVFTCVHLCSLVFTCVHLCSLVFTCVPLVFTCVHLCSLVFTCVLLVFYLCSPVFDLYSLVFHLYSTCVHLCSLVFICVLLVFICVHLCSLVFPLVWCFRLDLHYQVITFVFTSHFTNHFQWIPKINKHLHSLHLLQVTKLRLLQPSPFSQFRITLGILSSRPLSQCLISIRLYKQDREIVRSSKFLLAARRFITIDGL